MAAKPAGIDMDRNYVIVTLCILCIDWLQRNSDGYCSVRSVLNTIQQSSRTGVRFSSDRLLRTSLLSTKAREMLDCERFNAELGACAHGSLQFDVD